MLSRSLLLVSAILAIALPPGAVFAQNPAATENVIEQGYASYVSAMKVQQSIADAKETATFSWARVSYTDGQAVQTSSATDDGEQPVVSLFALSLHNFLRLTIFDQIKATLANSPSAAVAAPTQASIDSGSAEISQDTKPSEGSNKMMPIGIGVAFGVLFLLVGLVRARAMP